MRILIVNVNTTAAMTETIRAQAAAHASAGTEVIGLTPDIGPASVEGNFESYLAAVAVMDAVVRYDGPYDAVIQAGYGEHGREGLQELLDVPVVDITEAARSSRCSRRDPLGDDRRGTPAGPRALGRPAGWPEATPPT